MVGSRVPDSAVEGCEFKPHRCHLTVHKPDSLFPAFKKCVVIIIIYYVCVGVSVQRV